MISDAHGGLRRAISETLTGASWQRSRVHFMRNLLQKLPQHVQAPLAALLLAERRFRSPNAPHLLVKVYMGRGLWTGSRLPRRPLPDAQLHTS
jgi:hypothetical protein